MRVVEQPLRHSIRHALTPHRIALDGRAVNNLFFIGIGLDREAALIGIGSYLVHALKSKRLLRDNRLLLRLAQLAGLFVASGNISFPTTPLQRPTGTKGSREGPRDQ